MNPRWMSTPLALLAGALLAATASAGPHHAEHPALPGLTGTVVVVNQASDTVTLVDLARLQAYRHVPVIGGPHEVAVSADGRRAVVTNYNQRGGGGPQKTLSLLTLPMGEVIRHVDLGEYSMPHDVQWVDERRVVTTVEANRALLLVDMETGAIERVFRTEREGSHMLSLAPDRGRLFASNMGGEGSVSVFDFRTGAKLADVDTGAECEGVGVSPDGRWVWAGNRAEDTVTIIDAVSLQVVKTLDSPGFPYRVEFTPDGRYALLPHARSGTLAIGDVAGQTLLRHIPLRRTEVDNPSTAGVFPHPDNRHAFVTVRNDNSVLVVDIESGETLARIAVQESPDGVGYSPLQRGSEPFQIARQQ